MKLKNLLLLLGVVTICSSCIGDSTDTGNPTISATTTGVCTGSGINNCAIILTYNTNNNTGLRFTVAGNSSPQSFTLNGLNNCLITNTSNTQSCTVTVAYTVPNPFAQITQNLVFSLGSASANQVTVSNY